MWSHDSNLINGRGFVDLSNPCHCSLVPFLEFLHLKFGTTLAPNDVALLV